MTIEAINEIGSLDVLASTTLPAVSNVADGFNELFTEGISSVNDSLKAANTALVDMALDKPVNTHEVMLTMEQAKMELRLVIEVRNKLLEGYQEVMRMQV